MDFVTLTPVENMENERSDFTPRQLSKHKSFLYDQSSITIEVPEKFDDNCINKLKEQFSLSTNDSVIIETGKSVWDNPINFLDIIMFVQEVAKLNKIIVNNKVLLARVFDTTVVDELVDLSVKNITMRLSGYEREESLVVREFLIKNNIILDTFIESSFIHNDFISFIEENKLFNVNSFSISNDNENFDNKCEELMLNCVPLYSRNTIDYTLDVMIWRDKLVRFYDFETVKC